MLYGKYSIECEFLENGTLSSFKGSSLRGAFGHALKKASCTVLNRNCERCILRKHCLYAKLFIESEQKASAASIPYPYIIEPPLDKKRYYQTSEKFVFSLILLGEINDYLPFFIYAFEQMGAMGIGKNIEEGKKHTRFKISNVSACHNEEKVAIYNAIEQKLIKTVPPPNIFYEPFIPNSKADYVLELTLETPLRFKADNKISSSLDFLQLYKLMSRRINTLFLEYGESSFTFDYHALVGEATEINTIASSLTWEEQERYSQKQGEKLKLGGLVGSITYKGNILPFLPLLNLTTLLHLGKQSSFGLGKVSYILKG